MPLRPFTHSFIDVPVRPITIGGVTFQRVIRYVGLHPRQNPDTGEFVILLTVQVRHFLTDPDGSAGPACFELVPCREETFRADNLEIVDVTTGNVVLSRTTETQAQWEALLAADPRPLMPRGDAYEAQMHSGPVNMVPQIREAMAAADAAPFFRFGGGPEPEQS